MATKRNRKPRPPLHLLERLRSLRQRIAGKADAIIITNPVDIRYLTGFVGDDSWALVRAGSSVVHVISDFRLQEQISLEAPHVVPAIYTRHKKKRSSLAQEVNELAARFQLKTLAVQPDHVTLAQRKSMAKALRGRRLVAMADGLLKQRAVKQDVEIKAIGMSLAIAQEAFRRTCRIIKPGKTEFEIAAHLEYQMRLLGADGRSFPTIIAVNANASLPHAIPGRTKVKRGGILLIDWGASYQGYCSDLTRVVGVGGMSKRMRQVYRIVREAQLAAIEGIAPGRKLADIDKRARDVITDAGYGKEFGHSAGHGLGLNIHEQPVLSGRADGQLEPGHVVTVEPGIYLPGVGGVRIEDDVLVTKNGRRVLSDLPTDLESAII